MHRFFALDPARSSGVPLNPQFRNPPPGGNDPLGYDDPVTTPAGDIAENPYWKRDVRRSYPKLSVVTQSDVVGLLTVGSAVAPKEGVLKIGDAGKTQLVEVKEEGEKGLSAYFEKNKGVFDGVLSKDGLPPTPTSRHALGKRYELIAPEEQTYGDGYVRRCQSGSVRVHFIADYRAVIHAGPSYKLRLRNTEFWLLYSGLNIRQVSSGHLPLLLLS